MFDPGAPTTACPRLSLTPGLPRPGVQDAVDSLQTEGEQARALREIRSRDPSFDMATFLRNMRHDVKVIVKVGGWVGGWVLGGRSPAVLGLLLFETCAQLCFWRLQMLFAPARAHCIAPAPELPCACACPSLQAYLTSDEDTIREHCSPEMIERLTGIMRAQKQQVRAAGVVGAAGLAGGACSVCVRCCSVQGMH